MTHLYTFAEFHATVVGRLHDNDFVLRAARLQLFCHTVVTSFHFCNEKIMSKVSLSSDLGANLSLLVSMTYHVHVAKSADSG